MKAVSPCALRVFLPSPHVHQDVKQKALTVLLFLNPQAPLLTPKKADGEQRAARRASECAGAGIGVRGGSDSAGKPCGRADSRSDVWGKGRVEAMPSSASALLGKVTSRGNLLVWFLV